MKFALLKSLGNKMLGFVTSLFGLSSAGGPQPGNGNIPNNAIFTQNQPKEKNVEDIPVSISNELRTRLDNLKTALKNQEYENAKTLSEGMYEWTKQNNRGQNQRTKSLLMKFKRLLSGMKNDITDQNCSTLISTLEMLLENDSLPITSGLAKILGELPQLDKLKEAPRKDKIRAIVEGSSKLPALLKNSKTFQEKVAQHPEKWETIVKWFYDGPGLPEYDPLTSGVWDMNDIVESLKAQNGVASPEMTTSFTDSLREALANYWPLFDPLRRFIGNLLYEGKISQFYELLEKEWCLNNA